MKFDYFEDKSGGWRWRLIADNGRIVADSAEAYTRRFDVDRAVQMVIKGIIDTQLGKDDAL